MRCDFCGVDLEGSRRLAGRVLADGFEMPIGAGWSEGGWEACDLCAPRVRSAVEDGAWGALAEFVSGGARYDGVLSLPWLSSLYARLARHARGYEALPWSEHHEVRL